MFVPPAPVCCKPLFVGELDLSFSDMVTMENRDVPQPESTLTLWYRQNLNTSVREADFDGIKTA